MAFFFAFSEMFYNLLCLSAFRLALSIAVFFAGWFVVSEFIGYIMGVSENDN